MSHPRQPRDSSPTKLSLSKDEKVEETLVIETGEDEDERVLSSNADGSSLTLLEEYSMRRNNNRKWQFAIAFAGAAISISFAFMIYKTL